MFTCFGKYYRLKQRFLLSTAIVAIYLLSLFFFSLLNLFLYWELWTHLHEWIVHQVYIERSWRIASSIFIVLNLILNFLAFIIRSSPIFISLFIITTHTSITIHHECIFILLYFIICIFNICSPKICFSYSIFYKIYWTFHKTTLQFPKMLKGLINQRLVTKAICYVATFHSYLNSNYNCFCYLIFTLCKL